MGDLVDLHESIELIGEDAEVLSRERPWVSGLWLVRPYEVILEIVSGVQAVVSQTHDSVYPLEVAPLLDGCYGNRSAVETDSRFWIVECQGGLNYRTGPASGAVTNQLPVGRGFQFAVVQSVVDRWFNS